MQRIRETVKPGDSFGEWTAVEPGYSIFIWGRWTQVAKFRHKCGTIDPKPKVIGELRRLSKRPTHNSSCCPTFISDNGYGYPLITFQNKTWLMHRYVWQMVNGRKLKPGETVHHIDGNKKNFHPDNLQLRKGNHGSGSIHVCGECGSNNIITVPIADV